jgi:hypothetical protein
MAHPLILALFDDANLAAAGARALRDLGVPSERVSIVARTHDEEGRLAQAAGATPGSEIEDSEPASRLGELSGHLLAAVALVMPGIGPIVADGPLAAELGEAAGHLAGGVAKTLERIGVDSTEARQWESRIQSGAFLVGAHVGEGDLPAVRKSLQDQGATRLALGTWAE